MRKKINIFITAGIVCLAIAMIFAIKNICEDRQAGEYSSAAVSEIEAYIEQNSETDNSAAQGNQDEPDYVINPDMEMPEEIIDGVSYIGYIEFESLDLRLPIISDWSYPNLKKAPCRYYGTVYNNNMVIAAHNYQRHFGRLKDLKYGDEVTITDMNGNVFLYEVCDIEILDPYDTEDMVDSDADLTLFTCTIGGKTRVTVRCSRKNE